MDRFKDGHRHVLFFKKKLMWCAPNHKNVQDVRMQCDADELMCMIWCAMSHTSEHSGCPQVNRCMHHALQWDQPKTRVKNAIKKHLHHVVHMRSCAWCDASGARAVLHSWHLASWFYLVTNHGVRLVWIMSTVWDHAHQRARNQTKDCTTRKQILLCYSFFFHITCCILLLVAW